ncbi:class I SAM-dependent methyltransferase [Cellulosimicrobium funkei]|uniref:class I SAM-dependent methyltransferase n=1 Tax=Cellulosimicrobium funkei TaxID=264251 RepID=UPI0030F6D3D4
MGNPIHFDALADSYGSARPPYPAELWERVRRTGLVAPGRRAVDLGAGTGEATGPLLAAGVDVVAVEPGTQLAAVLAARHPTAEVVVARAEDAELGRAAFDLAVAATSIHWMDLDALLHRLHRALVPAGRFLLWRHVFGDPSSETPTRSSPATSPRARKPSTRCRGPRRLVAHCVHGDSPVVHEWSIDACAAEQVGAVERDRERVRRAGA